MGYKPPKGLTIQWDEDGFYCGSYKKGVLPKYFKLDLFMVRWLRPQSRWPDDTKIRDYNWDKLPDKLVEKLNEKNPDNIPRQEVRDYKYDITNPWKGNYWFVWDSKIRLPSFFISLFGRFYFGVKTYSAEAELPTPYDARNNSAGDITWMPEDAETGRYGAPSVTIRSKDED